MVFNESMSSAAFSDGMQTQSLVDLQDMSREELEQRFLGQQQQLGHQAAFIASCKDAFPNESNTFANLCLELQTAQAQIESLETQVQMRESDLVVLQERLDRANEATTDAEGEQEETQQKLLDSQEWVVQLQGLLQEMDAQLDLARSAGGGTHEQQATMSGTGSAGAPFTFNNTNGNREEQRRIDRAVDQSCDALRRQLATSRQALKNEQGRYADVKKRLDRAKAIYRPYLLMKRNKFSNRETAALDFASLLTSRQALCLSSSRRTAPNFSNS